MFKLADFAVELKVIGETLTLKTFVNSMAEMKLETLGEIGALSALAMALKNVGQEAMQLSTGYTTINKEYGTNIELLQRWQNVARASNVPVADVAQTFTRMQQLLASPFIGNPSSPFMKSANMLGIKNANRMSADQLNEALRVAVPNYIQRMTPSQGLAAATTNAGSLIEAMGATRSMMQMYTLGNAQFARREGSSPIYTQAEINNWTALNEQVAILKNNFQVLIQRLEAKNLPFLLSAGREAIDLSTGKDKIPMASNIEGMMLSTGGILGLMGLGLGMGSAAMITIPAVVLMELAMRGSAPKQVTVNQHNTTAIHAHGADPAQMADHSKRQFDRASQQNLTQALLLGSDMWAW